jgi:type I restriction enzyme, S subunit
VSLNLDRSTWKRVKLGDVVLRSRTQLDPFESDVDRYVAGGHIDTDSVMIRRSGDVTDGQMGSTFRYVFKPGQVLFVSARPYLRKTGVPDFAGVVADKTYVLEAVPGNGLFQDMLPFLLTSDRFVEYATQEATGSMNPRLLWGAMQRYEFDLPPLDEQQRMADLLWMVERQRLAVEEIATTVRLVRSAWLHSLFAQAETIAGFVELNSMIEDTRPICYGVLKPGPEYDSGRLIVDVKDYPSGQIQLQMVRRCDPEIEAEFKRSRLRSGDVLLSIRGTIGRVAVVPEQLDGHNISRDSARISGDPAKVLPGFLRLILESPDVQQEIRRTTTGLAVKGINIARIRALAVPNWTIGRQQEAVDAHGVIEGTLAAAVAELSSLSLLRTSLLSDLLGEADGPVQRGE